MPSWRFLEYAAERVENGDARAGQGGTVGEGDRGKAAGQSGEAADAQGRIGSQRGGSESDRAASKGRVSK
jgi:hypothetical protein